MPQRSPWAPFSVTKSQEDQILRLKLQSSVTKKSLGEWPRNGCPWTLTKRRDTRKCKVSKNRDMKTKCGSTRNSRLQLEARKTSLLERRDKLHLQQKHQLLNQNLKRNSRRNPRMKPQQPRKPLQKLLQLKKNNLIIKKKKRSNNLKSTRNTNMKNITKRRWNQLPRTIKSMLHNQLFLSQLSKKNKRKKKRKRKIWTMMRKKVTMKKMAKMTKVMKTKRKKIK